MALHDDLLEQAAHLALLDRTGPPRQANLRRAVSSAYYAVFHLLIAESVALLPARPAALRFQASRAFAHDEMKRVCAGIASGSPEKATASILSPAAFSAVLKTVAQAFSDLQDARHQADYDVSLRFSRTETLTLCLRARQAFVAWKAVRASDEAKVFLMALLLQRKWSR